jgi:HlyD family secretion protein
VQGIAPAGPQSLAALAEGKAEGSKAVLPEDRPAALQAAELDLERTTIRAPVNGIVVSRNVDVGQTVAASLQAPILFLIAQDLTQMQVDTNVSEADIGRIRVGQKVTFAVDAYQNMSFTGAVTQVRNAPITVQNVVTYNAVVQVANPDLRLKPGMTANVSFLVAERQDILKVPTAALRFQPEGVVQETNFQDGKAPAPQRDGGSGSGGGRFQEMQQQLTSELSLTPAQQTRLSEVFQKSGRQSRAMREEESEERRQAMRREMQAQIRAQIREMLTPEQRPKYEALLRAREESQPQARPGRAWVVGANGTPEPRPLTIGIANDTHTEVVSGDLTAGQQVITGSLVAKSSKRPAQPPGFGAGPRL